MSMFLRAALAALLALAPARTQDPPGEATPLQAADPTESMLAVQQDECWLERLLDADLDRREHHFAHLIEAVRRAPELRGMLARWAQDGSRPELAWTARLALRELAFQPAWVFRGGPNARGFGPANPWFTGRFPAAPAAQAEDPQAATEPAPEAGAVRLQRTLSFQVGPDGVRLRIERQQDGERLVESYEAATLQELFEQHPELAAHLPFGARSVAPREPAKGPWLQAAEGEPVRTDVLGVFVRAATASERSSLGLKGGVGVAVEKVLANSIAESMGLRPGQILVRLNGHTLEHADDIPLGLALQKENGEVRVTVVDRWGRERSRAWSPAPVALAPGPVKPPTDRDP